MTKTSSLIRLAGAGALALAAQAAAPCAGAVPEGGVVLTHPSGTVKLGVRNGGSLTFLPDVPEEDLIRSAEGIGAVGLRFVDRDNTFGQGANREFESITPGLRIEGWGAAYQLMEEGDDGSMTLLPEVVSGRSNDEEGDANISGGPLELGLGCGDGPYSPTCSSATATVVLGECLQITHAFSAAEECDWAFAVDVEITNVCDKPIGRVLYRRNMDWDVEIGQFENMVTLAPGNAADLLCLNFDGTCSGDPTQEDCMLAGADDQEERQACAPRDEITSRGPLDLGATFTFQFSNINEEMPLMPGGSRQLTAFYGAAPTYAAATTVVTEKLMAEAYSIGAPSVPELGAAHFFGYAGISGTPIPPPPTPPLEPLPEYSCECEEAAAVSSGRTTGIRFTTDGGCNA